MEIACGVTTAPRRGACYLPRTLASLRAAGFEPTVFAEPRPPKHRLGVIENWRRAVASLCDRETDTVLICQDDVVFCQGVAEWLAGVMWSSERTGVMSLYCPSHYLTGEKPEPNRNRTGTEPEPNRIKQELSQVGVITALRSNKVSKPDPNRIKPEYSKICAIPVPDFNNCWGACALLLPHDVAAAVAEHRIIREWPGDRGLDRCVGRVIDELGLDFWYLVPSLAQHVGDVSAIPGHAGGAYGRRAASDFVGEDVDVRDVWPTLLWMPSRLVFRPMVPLVRETEFGIV